MTYFMLSGTQTLKPTRMLADAQRDGHPAEYRWRHLRKFRNSIPCTTPQSLADSTAEVPCSNAANIGECKTWTQSEFCAWRNSVRGQEPPKVYICSVAAQDTAKHRAKFGWPPLNNVAPPTKPRCETPLNFARVPQTPEPISAASGPKFTILWDMWRRYCCLTSFFSGLSIHALVAKIQPDKVVQWCPGSDFLCFLHPVFPASRMQHISDLHSKFALRPHHV